MQIRKYIILITFLALHGCVTATTGMSPEQEAYFQELSEKKYDNVFSKEEIDAAWSRSIEFWKKYGLLKEATDTYIETYRSPDTDIKYILTREMVGNNYKIQMKVYLNNAFMGGFAKRTIVFFDEFINTGTLLYPGLILP